MPDSKTAKTKPPNVIKALGRPVDTTKSATILNAARHEFFNIGFAQSSIESIAARAGVSKVTVYNRFKTKEALFAAAVGSECAVMRKALSVEATSGGTIRARLVHFGMEMVAFLWRDEMVRFERHLAVEVEHNPEIGLLFLDAGPRRLHQALSQLLDEAVADGELEIDDTELAAEHLSGMVKGLADLERRFGANVSMAKIPDPKAAKRVNSAVDLFLKSYGKS
ncbi:TetR/AcrR family transcriptional regulator C-terminal domain-containing protein [Sphingorhabdus sp. Alg231-15]|uniref:TetR/AcrR family transcriptional regulator C-terminal domain-containing protein n=1 Tax=Sphingorhabdus sp. Alg231-15 TaxID=1922222 RepID=UPI000D55CC97